MTEFSDFIQLCHPVYRDYLDDLLSWLQDKVKAMCTGNLATEMCETEECHISTAEEILEELGYYLSTANFQDNLVCL